MSGFDPKRIGLVVAVAAVAATLSGSPVAYAAEAFSTDYYYWRVKGAIRTLVSSRDDSAAAVAARVLSESRWLLIAEQSEEWSIVSKRLTELLQSGDPDMRSAAAEALGNLKEHAKDAVPTLAQLFEDRDPGTRSAAAKAVGELGEHAKDAVPTLVQFLESQDYGTSSAAAEALGNLKEHAKDAVPTLVQLLESKDVNTRSAAVQVIARLGEHAKGAVPMLVQFLESQDYGTRSAAAEALGNLKEHAKDAVPTLVELLESKDPDTRSDGLDALGRLGEHAKGAVPMLAQLLENGDPNTRGAAAFALGTLGEYPKATVPTLIKLLQSTDRRTRGAAAFALGKFGEHAKPAVPRLAELLQSDDDDKRLTAASALGELGEHAKPAVPRLAELLEDSNPEARYAAASALGELGEHAKPAVPRLAELLGDPKTCFAAANALDKLGEHAKPAVPTLVKLLLVRDGDTQDTDRTRSAVFNALGQNAKAVVTLAMQLLENSNADTRHAAVEAFGRLGDYAEPAVPTLIKLLKDRDPNTQRAAALALGRLGEHAEAVVPTLIKLLEDRDPNTQRAAVEALGRLGDYAEPAVPRLAELLGDPNTRSAAVKVIRGLGEHAKGAVPMLAQLLENTNSDTRSAAVEAIRGLGEHAKSAVPMLARLLENTNPDTRNAAAFALGMLGEYASSVALELATAINRSPQIATTIEPLLRVGPPAKEQALRICALALDVANSQRVARGMALAAAYLHGASTSECAQAARWLENAVEPRELSSGDDAASALKVIAAVLAKSNGLVLVVTIKDRMESIVLRGMDRGWWTSEHLAVLESVDGELRSQNNPSALFAQQIQQTRIVTGVWQFGFGAVAHSLLWLLLWFGYPRSRTIQSIFFWNKWVRRLTGLGYVGFLLTWVPVLRRRLLRPFREELLAEAKLTDPGLTAYFPCSRVVAERTARTGTIAEVLPRLHGRILLEGESGLGKTLFARQLTAQGDLSRRPTVFLPARFCEQGVFEAIRSLLLGHAADEAFLRSILYAGGIDVCVDGLNEVAPDTRQKISEFAARPGVRNLLLVSQPIGWKPPAVLERYRLLPLERSQIVEFAKSRWQLVEHNASVTKEAFEESCEALLANSPGGSAISESMIVAARNNAADGLRGLDDWAERVLSNPMDLTSATQLIAHGANPNLRSLYDQQYRLMAADYKDQQRSDFPLSVVAERALEMRLNDETALRIDDVSSAVPHVMEHHHLLVRRFEDRKGSEHLTWVFRHDRIFDFFVAHALMGNSERQCAYFPDPRLHGAYLMLAMVDSLESARNLERQLIDYAAASRDHALSDDFVNLLNARAAHRRSSMPLSVRGDPR